EDPHRVAALEALREALREPDRPRGTGLRCAVGAVVELLSELGGPALDMLAPATVLEGLLGELLAELLARLHPEHRPGLIAGRRVGHAELLARRHAQLVADARGLGLDLLALRQIRRRPLPDPRGHGLELLARPLRRFDGGLLDVLREHPPHAGDVQ